MDISALDFDSTDNHYTIIQSVNENVYLEKNEYIHPGIKISHSSNNNDSNTIINIDYTKSRFGVLLVTDYIK